MLPSYFDKVNLQDTCVSREWNMGNRAGPLALIALPLFWYISGGVCRVVFLSFVSVSFFWVIKRSDSGGVWRFIRIFFEGVVL